MPSLCSRCCIDLGFFELYKQSFQLPIHVQQSKTYMGQAEAISLSMTLPVHGYVPGQTIPIQIVVTNPSTVLVRKIRTVFKKVMLLFL